MLGRLGFDNQIQGKGNNFWIEARQVQNGGDIILQPGHQGTGKKKFLKRAMGKTILPRRIAI